MNRRAILAIGLLSFCLCATPASATYQDAPDFSWTQDGATVHLSDLRGKVIVINFFATWCPPCRSETAAFVQAFHANAGRQVEFVGVDNAESVAQVTKYAVAHGIDYPLVIDSKNILLDRYAVSGLPTTVIVDANGVIVHRVDSPLDASQITDLVDRARAGTL
jgi:cytochrome c biogenesis protein CcmG/thiol:disulfide interchange protein DsbE